VVASPDGTGPLDEVLSLGPRALDAPQHRYDAARKQWSYVVDPHPRDARRQYQVVVLDTRTCRGFPAGNLLDRFVSHLKVLLRENLNPSLGLVGPSALLSEEALERQLGDRLREGLVNVVVSPAPVFGLPLVDDVLQQVLVAKDNPEVADNEAWQANPDAFQRLFDRLAGKEVVLLSGDVHYGFSNDVRVTSEDPPRPGRVVQLCSSAMRNESTMTVMLGVIGRRGTLEELWDVRSPENSRRLQALLETEVRDLEQAVRSFSEADIRAWWAETPLFVDPMQAYLRLKNASLFNLRNLLPGSLQAMAVGTAGLRNLFASARGGGVFAEERYTVHFLRDETAAEYPDVVGCNNLGRVRLLPGASRPHGHVRHELHHYPHPHPDASLATAITTHGTVPRWEYIKREMARLAQEELLRWRTPTGGKIKESAGGQRDPYAETVLDEYYRVAGIGPPAWGEGDGLIWSAAFVSYLVTRAGGAEAFGPSPRHIDYVRRAKRNRTADDQSNPFWLYDVSERDPQVGDLVCFDRPPKNLQGHRPLTYADVDEQGTQFRPAHCDVVVEATADQVRAIGGNLGDSVDEVRIRLVPGTGRVDVTRHPKCFAVLAVRTDV
jgi:hypothetical protein